MNKNFAEQLILYQSNILPSLLEKLSQQLHVSISALKALEIGYALHNNCWVFPERDEYGDIIGLSFRQWNNKKHMFPGSKRGLIYVPNIHRSPATPNKYCSGPRNWIRTTEDILCPICGKPDWCLVSSENPTDPKAVLCCRIKKGAVKSLGEAGYLHILKPEGELSQAGSVLLPSEYPLLIVEGATDVAAALDIDLVAVGRPNSTGCLDKLTHLVAGRNIVVLGENDAGAGKEGMEKAFEILQPLAKQTVKLLPPEGIKDLRQWITQGLTRKQFLKLIHTTGSSVHNEIILLSVAPLDLAKQWLEATYYQDDIFTLRVFHGSWYAYTGQCYREIERANLRQQLYRYLGDKQYKKIHAKGFDILNYDPTKHKLDEIMDALLAFCPITAEEIPCWLDKNNKTSNPKHILVFPNGYLDISGYTKRDEDFELRKSTPHFFSLASYPYKFNPNATCALWHEFLEEIFADDPAKIILLQEWFGYNLIPDNSQEKFMMLLGPTRAGKGTILDVLAYILGEEQVLATSFRDYTRRFAIFPFLGKLAAVIGDVSVGTNYDATEALNLLKRITGNDAIMIERKGKDITQTCVKLYTRFTMAANVMPRLPDFARTIESRMLVIQFLTSFMGREDTTLKTRLRIEAPGILLWALKGLQRLQKNRDFTLPATHNQILRRVRGEITPFTEFISDCCSLGEGRKYFILSEHLYECWKQWAIKNGERPQTVRWLNRSLLSLFPGCKGSRRLINGRRKRIFLGLRLRPEIAREMGLE
jgi:putative DNA primase/helicase